MFDPFMRTPLYFSPTFAKGNNVCDFLFVSVNDVALRYGAYSERKEFPPGRANSFFKEWAPSENGGKT